MIHVAGTFIKIYLQNVSNVGQYFMHAAYGTWELFLMKFELKQLSVKVYVQQYMLHLMYTSR